MNSQALRFVNPGKRRWYRLELGHDLLGDLVLTRRWGALGSRLGGHSVQVFASLAEGQIQVEQEQVRRRYRGYVLEM